MEREYVREKAPPSWDKKTHGGTSQHLNWQNFRNETFRGAPVPEGLSDPFFLGGLKDKYPGILEFDFVSTTRLPPDCPVIPQRQLEMILEEWGLKSLPEDMTRNLGMKDLATVALASSGGGAANNHKSKAKFMLAVKEVQIVSNRDKVMSKVRMMAGLDLFDDDDDDDDNCIPITMWTD